nr:helicase-related protein [Ruminococcus sp. NK3A76]
MYPNANLLCVTPKTFVPKRRADILSKIQHQEFDGIIMAYSCFDMLEISDVQSEKMLKEKLTEIDRYLNTHSAAKSAVRVRENIIKSLDHLSHKMINTDVLPGFDELGITGLFVDEAHNYKNIPLNTRSKFKGINTTGSAKCKSMLEKIRTVQKQNNGRGVTLATATPITNSVSDCFAMQTYLQHGELKMLGLDHFHSWVGMFAEAKEEFEIDVDTSQYRMYSRFNKYNNLQELITLFSMITDHQKTDISNNLPKLGGYTNCVVAKTQAMQMYLDNISQRADDVRSGLTNRRDDNMLKITTDGRKAALDIRLVEPVINTYVNVFATKVYRCAENVFEIWASDPTQKYTQLVFCDISVPKQSFNIYDELKRLLINMGIPDEQIAFIHDADTEARRASVLKKMNDAGIRVLIGSTFKLGLGVNVQTYLKALHHLDVPWRPADMTQREGRILRQGNTNKEVQIFRYITEGSFDAYSWQLLESKQRFISQLISGDYAQHSGDEVDNTALSYGEVKALAVGDPMIKKRVETANELTKYTVLQKKLTQHYEDLRIRAANIPTEKEKAVAALEKCFADIEYLKQQTALISKEERRAVRESIAAAIIANARSEKEVYICNYRGFSLYVPAYMIEERPRIKLSHKGQYRVELGESSQGYIVRIDNHLESLPKNAEKLKTKIYELNNELEQADYSLKHQESYVTQIIETRNKLEQIDKKLRRNK